jgi:hypothetical protein
LAHRLLYTHHDGRLIHSDFARLHWPASWH